MSTPATHRRRRLGVGAALVVVLAAVAASVVLGLLRSTPTTVEDVPTVAVDVAPAAVYVHVAGAVARPGLYRLDEGARVVDAVAAAGGLNPDADAVAINLARPITDGEQLHVPVVGAGPPAAEAAAADGRVRLNAADAAALEELPGIGPAIAGKIIAWRDENGPFTSVDDLLAVPGIGEKLLAGMRDLVAL